jgi:glutamate 5-kinase
MKLRQQALARVHRLVVKVGSGVVGTGVESLVSQIAALQQAGTQVILVSSGAIAAGMGVLDLKQRPKSLAQLQACAAIGQGKLMAAYDSLFGKHRLHVAQVLLTHDDLRSRQRHLNARNTLLQLLDDGVIPVINENDTVAVEEIKFGDNDRLSALVATLVDADLLVILSHVPGLLDRRSSGSGLPAATGSRIPIVPAITDEIEALAGGTDRQTSVGGMKSKIEAAKIVTRAGIPLVIADGERPVVLPGILAREDIGTIFLPQGGRLESRKRWIAFFQHPTGKLFVDDGAQQALIVAGKSLLAKGVARREGETVTGNVVSICDLTGNEFARGLTRPGNVLVHRDDLVVL